MAVDRETSDDEGIPQFVSADEQTTPSRLSPSPPPAPVIDLHTLAVAVKSALEYERPTAFEPVNEMHSITTTATTYQIVVQWLPKVPGGVLKEISVTNDPNAQYRLMVAGKEMFKDEPLSAALTIDYQRMRVPGANDKDITIYAKSTTGVSITVEGLINGEQLL